LSLPKWQVLFLSLKSKFCAELPIHVYSIIFLVWSALLCQAPNQNCSCWNVGWMYGTMLSLLRFECLWIYQGSLNQVRVRIVACNSPLVIGSFRSLIDASSHLFTPFPLERLFSDHTFLSI